MWHVISRSACSARAYAVSVARPWLKAGLNFVAGDALALPLRDVSFDAVTISFGLRNVADPQAALREMLRVTRPGGRLVVCEFSHVPSRAADQVYQRYLERVLPSVAGRVGSNPEAYAYLAESIKDWPGQAELARWLHEAGWSAVRWRNLSFGIVAVHSAVRPGAVRQGGAHGAVHGVIREAAENSVGDSGRDSAEGPS